MDMISFGSVFLELVFGHVPAPPEPGQEIFADDFAVSVGGAVTSATAAARSGARVGVCTVLGDDRPGRRMSRPNSPGGPRCCVATGRPGATCTPGWG